MYRTCVLTIFSTLIVTTFAQTSSTGKISSGTDNSGASNSAGGQSGSPEISNNGYQFNQGVQPYSYDYNTGIRPYSYSYTYPQNGKPQVSGNLQQPQPQFQQMMPMQPAYYVTQSEQDRSCILLVQMQRRTSSFVWVHVVLQVRDSQDNSQQPVIICTNQVLSHSYRSVSNDYQWNPSPPWSETTQKVPDIAQQELCYLSRTPPTPTSAPLSSSNGVAFSFDWMPEQFVPIVDAATAHNNNNNHTVPNGLSHSHPMLSAVPMSSIPLSSSPSHHKYYNLDRSPENTIREIHEERHSR